MYCVNGKPRSSLLIESTDSMILLILILILQWTYRDSVVSSDARLHVHPIHFPTRRAVCCPPLSSLPRLPPRFEGLLTNVNSPVRSSTSSRRVSRNWSELVISTAPDSGSEEFVAPIKPDPNRERDAHTTTQSYRLFYTV